MEDFLSISKERIVNFNTPEIRYLWIYAEGIPWFLMSNFSAEFIFVRRDDVREVSWECGGCTALTLSSWHWLLDLSALIMIYTRSSMVDPGLSLHSIFYCTLHGRWWTRHLDLAEIWWAGVSYWVIPRHINMGTDYVSTYAIRRERNVQLYIIFGRKDLAGSGKECFCLHVQSGVTWAYKLEPRYWAATII